MRNVFLALLFSCFVALTFARNDNERILAKGEQPQVSIDTKGTVRIVFGEEDKIYCSTSTDNGLSFSVPVLVAEIPNMHLGMTRGPQLASSGKYSIITAVDEAGSIHAFKLDHNTNKWEKIGLVNDSTGSGPEGLMSIAADERDNFYAAWLDIRIGKRNNIFFSSLAGNKSKWTKNTLAYKSPEGNVCECCKPTIAVKGSKVAIMFRNWLQGARDLYLVQSLNKGKDFSKAQKLGIGTWKLSGCPMDGGAIAIDESGDIHTAWRREGSVFYCRPGEIEREAGLGRGVSLALQHNNPVVLLQAKEQVKAVGLQNNQEQVIGEGGFLKSVTTSDDKTIYVWEQAKQIKFARR